MRSRCHVHGSALVRACVHDATCMHTAEKGSALQPSIMVALLEVTVPLAGALARLFRARLLRLAANRQAPVVVRCDRLALVVLALVWDVRAGPHQLEERRQHPLGLRQIGRLLRRPAAAARRLAAGRVRLPDSRLQLRADQEGQLIVAAVLVRVVSIPIPLAQLHPVAVRARLVDRVVDADEPDARFLRAPRTADALELVHRRVLGSLRRERLAPLGGSEATRMSAAEPGARHLDLHLKPHLLLAGVLFD
eukprot:1879683-Prymnesium_polylepis.2